MTAAVDSALLGEHGCAATSRHGKVTQRLTAYARRNSKNEPRGTESSDGLPYTAATVASDTGSTLSSSYSSHTPPDFTSAT